jgi:hypothetical protein
MLVPLKVIRQTFTDDDNIFNEFFINIPADYIWTMIL